MAPIPAFRTPKTAAPEFALVSEPNDPVVMSNPPPPREANNDDVPDAWVRLDQVVRKILEDRKDIGADPGDATTPYENTRTPLFPQASHAEQQKAVTRRLQPQRDMVKLGVGLWDARHVGADFPSVEVASCAHLRRSRPRNLRRPVGGGPVVRKPAHGALKPPNLDIRSTLDRTQLLAVIQRAGADGRKLDFLDRRICSRDSQ